MARKPKAGERVKLGRRMLVLPGVRSMTDPDPVAPAIKPSTGPGAGESDKPTDELSEELTRLIKTAYQ